MGCNSTKTHLDHVQRKLQSVFPISELLEKICFPHFSSFSPQGLCICSGLDVLKVQLILA